MLDRKDKFFCDKCGGLQEAQKRMLVKVRISASPGHERTRHDTRGHAWTPGPETQLRGFALPPDKRVVTERTEATERLMDMAPAQQLQETPPVLLLHLKRFKFIESVARRPTPPSSSPAHRPPTPRHTNAPGPAAATAALTPDRH